MAKKQSPESFVQQYLSLAQAVGAKTGVAPASLLGQWGLETGWGKSVIPGTNNLGNIKDFSGQGPKAVDNLTKSTDAYRAFDTPAGFGDHYAGLLGRKYKTALNAGEDSTKFFTELKRGGYAEDAGYIQKGVQATNRVNGILGSMPARSPLQMPDETFAKQAPPVMVAQAPEQPVQQAMPVQPMPPIEPPVQMAALPEQTMPMSASEQVAVNQWDQFQNVMPVQFKPNDMNYVSPLSRPQLSNAKPNFSKFKDWLSKA